MKAQSSFNIKVNSMFYIVKPYFNLEHIYTKFLQIVKSFSPLKNNEGNWVTDEDDVVPISESLIEDIGEQHELQL